MRKVVSGIIIQERQILLVRKNQTWLAPGGKPNEEESDENCLQREFGEELSNTRIKNILPYAIIEGKAPHKGDQIRVHYYFAELNGKLGEPSHEILERRWTDVPEDLNLGEATRACIQKLRQDSYL